MESPQPKYSDSSLMMMWISIFISMIVIGSSTLPKEFKYPLAFLLFSLLWLPFNLWLATKQKKHSSQEKEELEAKFAAQDAELLEQANKHHG